MCAGGVAMRWLLVLALCGCNGGGAEPIDVLGTWSMTVTDAAGTVIEGSVTVQVRSDWCIDRGGLVAFTPWGKASCAGVTQAGTPSLIRCDAGMDGYGPGWCRSKVERATLGIQEKMCLFLGCVQWIDGVSLEDRGDGTLVGVTKVYWYDRPKDGQLVRVVLSGRKPLPDAAR